MPKRAEGYRGYMGRRTKDVSMGKTLIVLLALALLLIAAGLLIAQRYVVYTDQGVRIERPSSAQRGKKDTGDVSVSVEVEIAKPPATPLPAAESQAFSG